MSKRKLTDIRQVGRPKVYVDRTKRKFKGGEFDLYGEYKPEKSKRSCKELRKDKTKMLELSEIIIGLITQLIMYILLLMKLVWSN